MMLGVRVHGIIVAGSHANREPLVTFLKKT